jgi:hypothetical protein
MKPNCIAAVAEVFGREPTDSEVRKIEIRLAKAMRTEAMIDPDGWTSRPLDDQLQVAAARAAEELKGEAALKVRRKYQQVVATARLQRQLDEFPGSPFQALARAVAFHADGKGSQMSIESAAKAIERRALGQILETLEATHPRFMGLFENPDGVRALVRELHGQDSGNPDAKAGAKRYREVSEALRQRFNRGGGDVGFLEDWGMPHHHSQLRVAKAGKEAWIAAVMPLLNRGRYVTEAGARMSDAELVDFLGAAWTSIATGGVNKLEPGKFRGNGMRANSGNESRQIHFKDGDSYLDYQQQFGERAMYDVLTGHVQGVAKDIALVETFGPNPDATFMLFQDRALQQSVLADPVRAGKHQKDAISVENLYNLTAGKTEPVGNAAMAQFFDGLRNLLVSSRLGSAALSSITDEGTMRLAAHSNNLPEMRLLANELAAFNPANKVEKRLANRAGLGLNALAAELNRFGNGTLGSGWTSKMATATLRASGLIAMTEARKRAFGVTYMSAIGQIARDFDGLGALDKHDNRILLSKGITDTDFAVWKRATQEDWGNGNDTMLTPESIYRIPDEALAELGDPQQLRDNAATRLLGVILEETDMAVIEPGVRERALMMSNLQRGTLKGELTRSFFLFKAFPLAMITRHWVRALSEPTLQGRAGYLAALAASTTILGMAALQAQQLVSGKDPRDMTDARTWIQATLRGGALSIFGDFLFADTTQYGQSLLATVAGPVAGLAEDVFRLTQGTAVKAAKGEEADIGANLVRFGRSNIPAANLWYTKAAVDHLIFHQLQEYFSPGYIRRMSDRARKEYDQEWWWTPGEAAPDRAPDMGRAVGSSQ